MQEVIKQWRMKKTEHKSPKHRSLFTGERRSTTNPLQSLLGRQMQAIRVFLNGSVRSTFLSASRNTLICSPGTTIGTRHWTPATHRFGSGLWVVGSTLVTTALIATWRKIA